MKMKLIVAGQVANVCKVCGRVWHLIATISVVFHESVRLIARDCFEKKGSERNCHFQGTADFG